MNVRHSFPKNIFRAYDIRGKLSYLTTDVVRSIAYGLAQQYKQAEQTQLVIGYDARLTSPAYAHLIEEILVEQGLTVTNIGCCSTPMMYYIAREFGGNGIMVTASHNPKSDNGIKWILRGEPPSPEMIQQVGEFAQTYVPTHPISLLELSTPQFQSEFCKKYQQAIFDDIQLKRPLKVVLDGLHGSAGHCAKLVLEKIGCEVIALRTTPNGEFPDHAPDPSHAAHLKELRKTIVEQRADIGIALDGDGDRVVLLDEKANILTADRLLSLFAQMCLEQQPDKEIVFDVKCSLMVQKTVERLGGKPKMIRTGSSFLRSYLSKSKGLAIFGGEYAGHYVFNDGRGFGYDDGIYAALRVMEYFTESSAATVSDLFSIYPERCCTEDTYISTHQSDPKHVLQDIEILSHRLGAHISKIDGVRLDFDDGFGIIRASNTGEYFTVRFDADSPLRLKEIQQKFIDMLQERYPQIAQELSEA
ncbi:phosphomannomutase [Acinetobacter nosocomialis]|uniref:phosphomannomutase/phosphoglucomutase n=1 Tax=Acinetobacter calcoaceticus/baumannii complex TaxID=909768 RepID=UPI000445A6B1|nr:MULTISPECIES: phosphomannomutase/phosphoglucomutase [Acinetobacter calcoaceticus/baumannii complex]AJB49132.1 phosphomannomutase [Acinetobacter nosocomialis]EXE77983.1 phosphoglucomutase/phosphomannomutase, C-terminal domain protein [Acinetobacter sp. 1566109]MBJ9960431.1 phosphomannomutase/phosphoglucomutase [Acinetobacter nosocomialis]MBR7740075.1 phosphomannomutase/phosphoglucomutase [Acinetobacter nosocomialis]MBR7750645.1 phosphomannomutase/phosphoglucomutase [Acinetobacter nosocomiali